MQKMPFWLCGFQFGALRYARLSVGVITRLRVISIDAIFAY